MLKIIIQGCRAGSLAGLIWGILLLSLVSPLIQEAEKYEVSGTHMHENVSNHTPDHGNEGEEEFEPNEWQRPLLTLVGSTLLGISFGIIVGMVLGVGMRLGVWDLKKLTSFSWIICLVGLAIFQGLPSLGLPPQLPGVSGAENDFTIRQNWWALSILCSLGSLMAFLLGPQLLRRGLKGMARPLSLLFGIILLVLPFVTGVPEHSTITSAPRELLTHFQHITFLVNGNFWVIFGGLLFYFLKSEQGRAN